MTATYITSEKRMPAKLENIIKFSALKARVHFCLWYEEGITGKTAK